MVHPSVSISDPTQRFSSRVENYIRYRPGYPKEIISVLKHDCGLTPHSIVADIGSGTGLLAELFLANGNKVFGVEPNLEMRQAGERLLASSPAFKSIAGKAETTTLENRSIDFITAGQAFHWFDREHCRVEFARILRPGGWVVLVWNDRRTESSPFLAAYEKLLLKYSTDYNQVNHRQIDLAVQRDFFKADPRRRALLSYQAFDFEGLKGRLLSSSYVPEAGQPGHNEMIRALKDLFDQHEQAGQVTFHYDTRLYYSRLH